MKRVPDETEDISEEDVEIREQNDAAKKILGGMENLLELSAQARKDKVQAEERGRQVGDKCKLMRPKERRVRDKCGKQVWETSGRQV